MSRTLSSAFRAMLMAERTDEAVIALVTIEHPELDETLRLSSHPTVCLSVDPLLYGTLSRGQVYLYVDLRLTLPEDKDGTPPALELRSDNVGREQIQLLRSARTPASVTVELLADVRPDLVEAEFPDFDLVSAEYDENEVSIGLSVEAMATEPFPADTFTPSGFRGLF